MSSGMNFVARSTLWPMLRLGATTAAFQHVVVMVLLVVAVAVLDAVAAGTMIPMPLALSSSSVAGRDISSRGAGSGLINPSLEKTSASVATTGYDVDTNWYVNSGATDHITGDLEKL
jgi:hypothetical protein